MRGRARELTGAGVETVQLRGGGRVTVDVGAGDLVGELERRLRGVAVADCEFPEPDAPIYLTGVSCPPSREAGRATLGLLIQPGNSTHRDVGCYGLFGADNGCFSAGDCFDVDAWLRWVLRVVVPRDGTCLFVVAPDVVGDAAATAERSARLLPLLRKLGLPAAFVAQDGLEGMEVDWDSFDVCFIGGSTEWKLSSHAGDVAAEARRHGKWVHYGRVNSWKRIALVRALHADSFDGTFLGFGPVKNWPKLAGWLDRLEADAAACPAVVEGGMRVPASVFDYGAAVPEHRERRAG